MLKLKDFPWPVLFSRTFQDSPVFSSTIQACANPVYPNGEIGLTRRYHEHMGMQATVFSRHLFQKAYNQDCLEGHNYLDKFYILILDT